MKWLTNFVTDLEWVFAECEHKMSTFPSPLREQGLSFLSKFNVLKDGGNKNFICCLLPFWMREVTGLHIEDCRKMSVANVFYMLYFYIQDAVIDTDKPEARALIPLANLCSAEFSSSFLNRFDSSSSFWGYYHQYMAEWAESVTCEAADDYFLSELRRTAGKSSPLKLSSTGTLLLSGQDALIAAVTDSIEQVLVTLQMLDDWSDWREDLASGAYNGLLSMARLDYGLVHNQQLTEELVEQFLYTRAGLTRYYDIAATQLVQEAPEGIKSLSYLYAFHKDLVDSLRMAAADIEKQKGQLLNGGANYWLSRYFESS